MKYGHHFTGYRSQSAESGFDTARALRVVAAAFGAKAAPRAGSAARLVNYTPPVQASMAATRADRFKN